jgi:hypothetical protein
MRNDGRTPAGRLQPAIEPKEYKGALMKTGENDTFVFNGEGTGVDQGAPITGDVGLWLQRWSNWRAAFEQQIGANARKYWKLYRNFDQGPAPGPNQAWRDRTVIPEPFKLIETRLPRLVLGQFGGREWFSVEGTDAEDETYEERVKQLLVTSIRECGKDRPDSDFFRTMMDGMRYGQIMGHVFFKPYWRQDSQWFKTKVRNAEGAWEEVEVFESTYDGVDLTWLGLSDLAIDTSRGMRRWAIERIRTSVQQLQREQAEYRKANGEDLYKPEALAALTTDQEGVGSAASTQQESFEEPRDTEGWPLTEQQVYGDPSETSVELWLCWDNINRTMTKIVNRSVLLDKGLSPTPDGLDPYISVPAVPVPGRAYGDSILNWTGPLAVYQTRLARARADEILLSIWQQFAVREGSLRSSQFVHRPGGIMSFESANPDRPLTDNFAVIPRRPVFQEAWKEEGYRQQQQESTAGADALSQGIEATQKSRDVSATEVQQRSQQGATRYQAENMYLEVALKGPLLRKWYDLLRQNQIKSKNIRVLGKMEAVDLTMLDRPVDLVIGGGIREHTKAEQASEVRELVELSNSPKFGPWIKPRGVLKQLFETWGRKNTDAVVYADEGEIAEANQAMAGTMPAMPGAPGGQGPLPAGEAPIGPPSPSPGGGGAPSGQGGSRPSGSSGNDSAPAPTGNVLGEV